MRCDEWENSARPLYRLGYLGIPSTAPMSVSFHVRSASQGTLRSNPPWLQTLKRPASRWLALRPWADSCTREESWEQTWRPPSFSPPIHAKDPYVSAYRPDRGRDSTRVTMHKSLPWRRTTHTHLLHGWDNCSAICGRSGKHRASLAAWPLQRFCRQYQGSTKRIAIR